MEYDIQAKAYELGYEKCGIVSFKCMDGFQQKLLERVQAVPISKYFYDTQRQFFNLQETYPWAKSIVVLALRYGKYKVPDALKTIGKTYLFDNRPNVHSAEYRHSLEMEEYLKALGLRVATERKFGIGGLRWAAKEAGIGIIRRNNFFYTELSGSWVHIEEFLIDREMELIEHPNIPECPKGCSRCVSACPTKSLSAPYTMLPLSCVSFLTTFGGRDTSNLPWDKFGKCIYGCDICQDVCPMNRGKWKEEEDYPGINELAQLMTPENLLTMSEDIYTEKIQPKFFYLSPDELWKWKVNTICYMKNNYLESYRPYLLAACSDLHEKVRDMAGLVCNELFGAQVAT